jgi:hypothetical protein
MQNMVSGIADSAAGAYIDQKELAKKNKEIAAKIKSTQTLLDNAKGIYKEFAPQIDAMNAKLSDPSLSDIDKAALSDGVTNSLNMFAQYGSDEMKRRVNEASIDQAARQIAIQERQINAQNTSIEEGVVDGKPVLIRIDKSTGTATPLTMGDGSSNQTSNYGLPTTPSAGSQGLGDPPMMADTAEGPMIPIDESQRIQTLSNGDEIRVYNGKQYTVLAPSVLPPMITPQNTTANAIDGSLALTAGNAATKPETNTSAIAAATGQGKTYIGAPTKATKILTPEEQKIQEIQIKKGTAELEALDKSEITAKQVQNSILETGKINIEKIDKFLKNPILLEATTGFGAEFARGFKKNFISDKVELGKQQLNKLAMVDILEMAKDVKPLSNDERIFLEKGVPSLTDPPLVWKTFLEDKKRILSTRLAMEEAKANGNNSAAVQQMNDTRSRLKNLQNAQNLQNQQSR